MTKEKTSNPAINHPTEIPVPKNKTTPIEIIPIHSEHAAPSSISTLIEHTGKFTKY